MMSSTVVSILLLLFIIPSRNSANSLQSCFWLSLDTPCSTVEEHYVLPLHPVMQRRHNKANVECLLNSDHALCVDYEKVPIILKNERLFYLPCQKASIMSLFFFLIGVMHNAVAIFRKTNVSLGCCLATAETMTCRSSIDYRDKWKIITQLVEKEWKSIIWYRLSWLACTIQDCYTKPLLLPDKCISRSDILEARNNCLIFLVKGPDKICFKLIPPKSILMVQYPF